MILKLYSIKDELSEFASPVTIQDEANAKRFFRYQVENTKIMADNPEDFSIWEIGEFNSETGEMLCWTPKLIERAKSTTRKE